jgi:hypothetical protein
MKTRVTISSLLWLASTLALGAVGSACGVDSDPAPVAQADDGDTEAALADTAGADIADADASGDVDVDGSEALVDDVGPSALPHDEPETTDVTDNTLWFHFPGHGWKGMAFCQPNHSGLTYPHGWPTPNSVGNHCISRVWLFQWNNRTGYKLCVSPHANVTLTRPYKSFVISPNLHHC